MRRSGKYIRYNRSTIPMGGQRFFLVFYSMGRVGVPISTESGTVLRMDYPTQDSNYVYIQAEHKSVLEKLGPLQRGFPRIINILEGNHYERSENHK